MLAIVTLVLMASSAHSQDCIGEAAEGSSCASGSEGAVKGSAMLQVRHVSSPKAKTMQPKASPMQDSHVPSPKASSMQARQLSSAEASSMQSRHLPHPETSSTQARHSSSPKASSVQARHSSSPTASSCSIKRAKTEPLTEEAFAQVSKSCCYEDIKVFMSRVIDEMGLKVCDEGGLSGMAPFYSCPPSPPTLADLKAELNKALPTEDSKCHWLARRQEKCAETDTECAISVMKPPPFPKPVASGFIAFKVANPAEMMRSSRALDVVQNDFALAIGIDTRYVNVVIGSGPLDGEEVTPSLFHIPASQAFYTLQSSKKTICKVFAAFSIQDSKPADKYISTPASTLDEAGIVNSLKHLDTAKLGTWLSKDLASVDSRIGSVEVIEQAICEKTSGRCTHLVIKEA